MVLGLVCGVWHLLAFLVSGTHQRDARMGVQWLILRTVLSSLIMTWPSLRTGGSILVAGIMMHLMNNSAVSSLWAFDLGMIIPVLLPAVALLRRDPAGSRTARGTRVARHVTRAAS